MVPGEIPLGSGVVELAGDLNHMCSLDTQGQLHCVGESGGGAPTTDYPAVSAQLSALGPIAHIASAEDFTCALFADGHVSCFGRADLSAGAEPFPPTQVPALDHVVQIAVGPGPSIAAVDWYGAVWTWGVDALATEPGGGAFSYVPVQVGVYSAVQVSLAREHRCALDSSGAVWCWGGNGGGSLGVPGLDTTLTPVKVQGLPAAAAEIALGFDSSYARLVDGSVWGWGRYADGAVPVRVPVPCP